MQAYHQYGVGSHLAGFDLWYGTFVRFYCFHRKTPWKKL
jgi:hypothetical protein